MEWRNTLDDKFVSCFCYLQIMHSQMSVTCTIQTAEWVRPIIMKYTHARTHTHTHTHTHTYIYIYIYIYIYFCACVCVCVYIYIYIGSIYSLIHICLNIIDIFVSIFFVNPFELLYWSYDIRWELVDKSSMISYFPSTFCRTFGHQQERIYYKSDENFFMYITTL